MQTAEEDETSSSFRQNLKVTIANQLFISHLINPLETFKKEISENFESSFQKVDFSNDATVTVNF